MKSMAKPTLPSLAALQSFEATARLGSLTKAAQERHLTHSAISRHVQALEHWCGQALFERIGPKLVLNAAGQRLRLRLNEPLQAMHAALDLGGLPLEPLRLKVLLLTSMASTWLMPRLPDFARRCPQISLSVEAGYEMVGLPPLQAVVAIRFGHFARTGLRCHRLWFDRMVAVAAPDWVQRYGTQPSEWPASQLLRHSHEAWPLRLPAAAQSAAVAGGTYKLAAPEGYEFNDALLLAHAALVGCGVAWLRYSLVRALVEEGRLCLLAQSEQLSDKSAWLVSREDTAELPAVREFCHWA